ncbi:metallopeptidase MepB [Rhizoctonia solani]|uniref:Mitochondrial intermediate peptidase n=1 Tax=Rhizoctonia solani TaxID=456999 RepID=A0A8H8T266_9AGAM|nr:metallopeptidase MepB [Rhizoctonia solani]QRW27191.1 metallopeptidase MepB [Rhizoctonia solani]
MASNRDGNYNYDASVPATALFAALFGLTLGLHILQALRGKCRYLIPLVIATLMEVMGYIFRILAIKKPDQLWPLIPSETLIITAPAFLAANNYMIFGRIMAYVGPEYGLVGHEFITKVFVGADIVAILTQASGGSMLSGDDFSSVKIGRTVLIVGLAFQVVAFGIFMFIALALDLKTRRKLGDKMTPIRPLIWAFYVSALLIIIRSIFRAIEFSTISFESEVQQGYAITHEWMFYVLDSLLILLATIVFNWIHPSSYLPSRKGLRMDGTTYEVRKFRLFRRKRVDTPEPKPEEQEMALSSSRYGGDDALLPSIFDSSSHSLIDQSSKPTGLFGNSDLAQPSDFISLAKRTQRYTKRIVDRIVDYGQTESGSSTDLATLVRLVDRLSDTLCCVIDTAEFVRNSHPDPRWVAAANDAYEYLCSWMNELNTHVGLYKSLDRLTKDPEAVARLSPEEKQVALLFIRDFEKSGIHLPEAQRVQFVTLSDTILSLGRQFLTEAAAPRPDVKVRIRDLTGVPLNVIRSLSSSDARGGEVWVAPNSWEARMILRYAINPNVRRDVFTASNALVPEYVDTLEALIKTRYELAKLVGSPSYAAMTLGEKMARDQNSVNEFLHSLASHHRPLVEAELGKLAKIKQEEENSQETPEILAWDRDYYITRYTSGRSSAIAPVNSFFSVGTAIQGLSRLFQHVYGMTFRAENIRPGEGWDPHVRKLAVIDESEGVIGWIYMDLFARDGKPGGAAHFTVRCSRKMADDELAEREAEGLPPLAIDGMRLRGRDSLHQLPVVVLMCDFSIPTDRVPSLLSWHEVETLFHEMGHAMHSMIGRTDYHNVSGTRCATDFVELPSILMEYFAASSPVLATYARHYSTGLPLDFSNLQAQIRAQSPVPALETHSQILMAALDQVYHSNQSNSLSTTAELVKLQKELGGIQIAPNTAWQTQFGHLFGYGASYYSYLFDRAIASQVWKKVFARDPLNREMGERYKREVLRHGGSKDPWHMLAALFDEPELADGGAKAMKRVGEWGIE